MDEALRKALNGGGCAAPRPLAHALGLSLNGVYQAVQRGDIKAVRVGRRLIIPNHEARRLLGWEDGAKPTAAEAATAPKMEAA